MRTSPESLNDPNNPSRYLREHATIFVNNPRIIENEERAELDKETREESRQVLLNHLASVCHNADYQLNPEEIMRRIDECQIEVEENIRREKREREEAEERDEIWRAESKRNEEERARKIEEAKEEVRREREKEASAPSLGSQATLINSNGKGSITPHIISALVIIVVTVGVPVMLLRKSKPKKKN